MCGRWLGRVPQRVDSRYGAISQGAKYFYIQAYSRAFFLGPLLYLMWPGGCVWATPHQKNCCPAHLAVTAVSTASESHPLLIYALSFCCPQSMHILALLRSSCDVMPPMAPMLMHTCPDPNHMSSPPPCPGEPPHRWQHAMSHPMTTQDVPHSSGRAPAPLTCPAPSQCAVAIPHASHMPFMCPSPSHNLTHVPRPPLMCPDAF